MAGINSTGTGNTRDYLRGLGCVFVGRIDPVTGRVGAGGYRFLGNVSAFALSVESESIEHKSSQCGGANAVDASSVTSKLMNLTMTLDEVLNFENLAMFLTGVVDTYTNPAVAGIASRVITPAVELGRWYDIATTAGVRATDFDPTDLSLTESTSLIPVPLVSGTDYTLDASLGRVFILSTAVNIAAGEALTMVLAADAAPITPTQRMRAFKGVDENLAILAVIENSNDNNHRVVVELHSVKLAAEGELPLISEEYSTMTFNGVCQFNSVLQETATFTTHDDAHA